MYRLLLLLLAALSAFAQSFESQALQISRDIQARHLPYGTVLSPMFPSSESNEIVGYTRCGDSAIWTGHYLAAETFRYTVTRTPEALEAARRALRGLASLVTVTGDHRVLARCIVPSNAPADSGPRNEEKANGEFRGSVGGVDFYWFGNTSRDQYLGALFGFSVAYEHLADERAFIREIVTPWLGRLIENDWKIVMPDGEVSTVFWLRPDQQLSVLQVARQINPDRFRTAYEELRRTAFGIGLPISLEALDDHGSYYKFNLDAIALYSLLRLEEESPRRGDYIATYRTFRSIIATHGNVFFNVIDRAIAGPSNSRDAETTKLMAQWLERPTRDFRVDLRSKYKSCGEDKACSPIPVPERVRTDFLWQRSPFLLYGGGDGRIESPGIDFILPYWMGRHYGLDFGPLAVSAASGASRIAPDSLASLFGVGLPEGNARVSVTDAAGSSKAAVILFSNAEQINFIAPAGLAPGRAQIDIRDASGVLKASAGAQVERVAPALFSAMANGKGPAAALAVRVERDGSQVTVPVFRCLGPLCITERLDVSDERPVYVSLYGTGIRGSSSISAVRATVGSTEVPVLYAGPHSEFPGLDQVNVWLPASVRGSGEVDLTITVDGISANSVRIGIR
ncbi:MAG TPA: hypothetical protein VER03_05100 [Bryobacteraceae bacterium]|nr:hypothetical protein [Bryobacteraceae bacterium]